MLAQQFAAVVVAVRGADHRVQVQLGRAVGAGLAVGGAQRAGGLAVDFDPDDRAVHPQVERVGAGGAADPRGVRVAEVGADLGHPHGGGVVLGSLDEYLDDREQFLLLGFVQGGGADAGVREDRVVGEGAGLHVLVGLGGRDDRGRLLGGGQGLDEGEAGLDLFGAGGDGGAVDLQGGRLGPPEAGAHHDLVAEHEVVDGQVVPVELEAPRFGRRRGAHDREVVQDVVEHRAVAGDGARRQVDLPDPLGRLQAVGAQSRLQ